MTGKRNGGTLQFFTKFLKIYNVTYYWKILILILEDSDIGIGGYLILDLIRYLTSHQTSATGKTSATEITAALVFLMVVYVWRQTNIAT